MTAQIKDSFRICSEDFTVLEVSEPVDFNPRQYGLFPFSMCTACNRGYICSYCIEEDKILLEDMYVGTLHGTYPEIVGVLPSEEAESLFGMRLYKGLNLEIPYTGKILIGKGFMGECCIPMYSHTPWAYKTLTELVFEKGKLTEKNDHSEIAGSIREGFMKIQNSQANAEEIDHPFAKTHVWWMKSPKIR